MQPKKQPGTLCFLRRGDELLLGMKKRGFGARHWNGFGGKKHEEESLREAARREFLEEASITIADEDLHHVGILHFSSRFNPNLNWEVHVFLSTIWSGEPRESEEMQPRWFSVNEIPFTQMWPDDQYWLPLVLAGKKIIAEFHFDATESNFEHQQVREVVSLEE